MATPNSNEKPDLIVGIDFGMTYTGVAWTNLSNPTQVEKRWPGQSEAGESKVPTKIIYSSDNVDVSWGFGCDEDSVMPGQRQVQWFKIYLDQDNLERARKYGLETPGSVQEAKKWVTDYLRRIYQHIRVSLQRDGQGWSDKTIMFLFSIPTTWTNQAIMNDFNKCIQDAGFGFEEKHTAQLELTEAEAAAVYTIREKQVDFDNGDIILVCDAGGGTTDLALFKVTDTAGLPILNQMAQVQGVGVGSTVIDRKFKELVKRRIASHADAAGQLPRGLPSSLANSHRFRSIKHGFGTTAGTQESYYLKLDGVQWDFSHAGLDIEGGRMRFSRTEIQKLFDTVVEGITRKVDEQLNWIKKLGDDEQVRYIILSGGLGSSEYVRTCLMERYVYNPHPNGLRLQIITSSEPHLAVVKGLIEDRRQKLESGRSVLITRIARASYGVVCMREFDPKVHFGEDNQINPLNSRKRWVLNQIDWLIKKGDTIETDSAIERPFYRTINPKDTNRKWLTGIVISHNDPGFLPHSMRQGGATKLCDIESNLSDVGLEEFREKGKHFWSGRKHHFVAEYSIKVIIAPADLKFELYFKDHKYSKGHNPISVEWDKEGAALKPNEGLIGAEIASPGLGELA